jgi:hypothetical protein
MGIVSAVRVAVVISHVSEIFVLAAQEAEHHACALEGRAYLGATARTLAFDGAAVSV